MIQFREAFLDDKKVLSIRTLDLSSNLIEVKTFQYHSIG